MYSKVQIIIAAPQLSSNGSTENIFSQFSSQEDSHELYRTLKCLPENLNTSYCRMKWHQIFEYVKNCSACDDSFDI